MPFGKILSRGFAAASRLPLGWALYFLLMGIPHGMGMVAGGLFSPEAYQVQPGESPSPQLIGLMGFGCFSCVWGLMAIFAAPWVTGGVLARMRDRMLQPQSPAGRMTEYGGRYYGSMLVLALIWLAIFAVLWGLVMLVGAAIAATQIQPGQPVRPEQWQQMNAHPANIAAGVGLFVVLTMVGVIWSFAQTIVVVDEQGPLASLAAGIKFCRRHGLDCLKLFLVFVLLNLPLWVVGPLLAALEVQSLPIRAALGLLVALYLPYVVLVGLGCAMSLYLARLRQADGDGSPPEAPGPASEPI